MRRRRRKDLRRCLSLLGGLLLLLMFYGSKEHLKPTKEPSFRGRMLLPATLDPPKRMDMKGFSSRTPAQSINPPQENRGLAPNPVYLINQQNRHAPSPANIPEVLPPLPVRPPTTPPMINAPFMAPVGLPGTSSPSVPRISVISPVGQKDKAAVAAPPNGSPRHGSLATISQTKGPAVSPAPFSSPAIHGDNIQVPKEHSTPVSPANYPTVEGPAVSPAPTSSVVHGNTSRLPVAAPPKRRSSYPGIKRPAVSPSTRTPVAYGKVHGIPAAAPLKETSSHLLPSGYSHTGGSFPVISPARHKAESAPNAMQAPISLRPRTPARRTPYRHPPSPDVSLHRPTVRGGQQTRVHDSTSPHPLPSYPRAPLHSPAVSHKKRHKYNVPPPNSRAPSASRVPIHSSYRKNAPPSLSHVFPPTNNNEPVVSPVLPPYRSASVNHRAPSLEPVGGLPPFPYVQGPSFPEAPYSLKHSKASPSPSPSHLLPSSRSNRPVPPPLLPPHSSSPESHRGPSPEPFRGLPPPPPDADCTPLSCQDPYTNSPPGLLCFCVLPIKVGLSLRVALYTFFTLVSELAQEIASGVYMKQSQVRIMGANAANDDPEKTIVLVDLVPLGQSFDNTTALLVYKKFWHKQLFINPVYFGDYDVLYVLYPGLPPSPPASPGDMNGDIANNNGGAVHPLAADVGKQKKRQRGSIIAISVTSTVFALLLCIGAAWFVIVKLTDQHHLPAPNPPLAKESVRVAGFGATISGDGWSSAPASFSSSVATIKGSAKSFSLAEMERATNKFDYSRIIGEGGFGRVYEGTLPDGKRVAIKVLKRVDQQGSREFLAEVEMLSRLHHRNLVKLIGICTEDRVRCLIYELVPNGSVESHLHGPDKETAVLDWDARLKIALGAARALAYLHEDSSPRVIHRDFKSSNILLEHDFTPKVSDFGLARTALGKGNVHISTHVVGTFGYVAPEYAMTGHLLVKSDVYSYGVVLLELLTGRKPINMLRLPGQENLVMWARPLLTNKEDLDTIVDPSLGSDVPFGSVAKVAAIASMCIQPEVDQRPFMSEVVQALKLVCNEDNEYKGCGSCGPEEPNMPDTEIRTSISANTEADRVLSASDLFSTSARFMRDASGSFRRYWSSGPLRTAKGGLYSDKGRGLSTGSSSEHGVVQRYVIRSEGSDYP